jgi:hypothetical protein
MPLLPFIALLLLTAGGLLEVAGVAFFGLDVLVGFCFVVAMGLGAAAALRARFSLAGLIACGLSALALGLHLAIHLGLLS